MPALGRVCKRKNQETLSCSHGFSLLCSGETVRLLVHLATSPRISIDSGAEAPQKIRFLIARTTMLFFMVGQKYQDA